MAINNDKSPLFSLEERVQLVEKEVANLKCLKVDIVVHPFKNLLIECAKDVGASILIRGLRAVSDFEYEFQIASINRSQNPEIESVFFTPDEKLTFISSSMVKELASYGGDISKFVHADIKAALLKKFKN